MIPSSAPAKKRSLLSGGWAAIVPLTAAIGAYLMLAFFPQMAEIRRLREEIAEKQIFIAGSTQRTKREKAVDEELAATRDYVRRHRGTTSAAPEVSAVFAEVAHRLKTAGVETTMFRPEPKIPLAAVERIGLTIGCRGTYDGVQAVLAGLEQMPHRIWVDELTLERDVDGGKLVCEIKPAIFAGNFEISD